MSGGSQSRSGRRSRRAGAGGRRRGAARARPGIAGPDPRARLRPGGPPRHRRRAAAPATVVGALERVHATEAQHALGRAGRSENVGHVFGVRSELRERVAGRWVVLVDDVVTTGATLGACGAALMAAGASAVSAVTVARER